MQSGSIARRYAKALMELAQEAGIVDEIIKDLREFEELLKQHTTLFDVLSKRSFSSLQQGAVLRDVLQLLSLNQLTNHFLLMLVEKHRMFIFDSILREVWRYYDELKGRIQVTVVSATVLPDQLEKQLSGQIEGFTRREVVLTKRVDPAIIGGVVTRVGDLLFDGSLSTQLARMKSALLKERIGQ